MPDLYWTIPVARWSSWPAAATAAPDIGFIEPIVRRRLSTLSRMALKVAHDCVVQDEAEAVRVVFASRHGELRRTTDILRAIGTAEPVSPTAFSLSVLNAMTGVFGIARGDRSAASAISAGAETLGYALLEAYAQYTAQPESPVLLVYADEPADPAYGAIEHEVQGGALAILVNGAAAAGQLVCTLSSAGEPAAMAAAGVGHEDESGRAVQFKPHHADGRGAASAVKSFATQGEALLHCLETGQPAVWPGAGTAWHWSLA